MMTHDAPIRITDQLREAFPSESEPVFSWVEVGEIILSFYAIGGDEESTKEVVAERLARLRNSLEDQQGFPRPQQGRYDEPRLEWLSWQFRAPGTPLSWCGAFHLVLSAEGLPQRQGCIWHVEEYKRFARLWTNQVLEAFRASPDEAHRVLLDERPFYWTLACDTEPRVEWTETQMHRYRKALTALVRVRSEDSNVYNERAMQEILASNLAFTTQELQLLSRNTGLIYVAKERFQQRDGFQYVRRAVIDVSALVRAMRASILLFRAELDRRLQGWLQQRVRGQRSRSLLRELMRYAHSASEILRQFDEFTFRITHQIGHEQAVFQALVERYQVAQLVNDLHQVLGELHYQIADLHNQAQSRRLRWINFLIIFPALYQAWKLIQECWPLLQSLFGIS